MEQKDRIQVFSLLALPTVQLFISSLIMCMVLRKLFMKWCALQWALETREGILYEKNWWCLWIPCAGRSLRESGHKVCKIGCVCAYKADPLVNVQEGIDADSICIVDGQLTFWCHFDLFIQNLFILLKIFILIECKNYDTLYSLTIFKSTTLSIILFTCCRAIILTIYF